MTGFLYNIRKSWRTATDSRLTSLSASEIFIQRYGQQATFRHVGMDIDRSSGFAKGQYMGQLYAVFAIGSGKEILPQTAQDLEFIAGALNALPYGYADRQQLITRLGRQLEAGQAGIAAHESTLQWLNPHAARFQMGGVK